MSDKNLKEKYPLSIETEPQKGIYARLLKRPLDFVLALTALFLLSPLLMLLCLIGAVCMKGSPFFFQMRPGKINSKTGKEKLFKLVKFRTMTNEKDKNGNLLPDEKRLNAYGRFLRSTSLDELPSLVNILAGSLSIVGPRPQLVRDMVFMSKKQRRRHSVSPGLTGLAQINGRNTISWHKKFEYDLQYINNKITFFGDLTIVLATITKVLKRCDIEREGTVSDLDYGDWLLTNGKITKEEYHQKQLIAKELLNNAHRTNS